MSENLTPPPPLVDGLYDLVEAIAAAEDVQAIGGPPPLMDGRFGVGEIGSINYLAIRGGDLAERNVEAFGRLAFGGWWLVESYCDSTGWDCIAGGSVRFARKFDELVRFGMSAETRRRAGLALPEDEAEGGER